MKRCLFVALALCVMWAELVVAGVAQASSTFDHTHRAWNVLLQKHVVWNRAGTTSQVDYAGLQVDKKALGAYLENLSAVAPGEFRQWDEARRLAFLVNAYNAFTVDLILTAYPDVGSIKDLGSFFQSPWKKKFFTLLGAARSLDNIEHDMIRARGAYDNPHIHVGVVCASVGCPALRNEAFTDLKIEQQLADSMRRFLSDRSRNRYNPRNDTLEVSKVFDWYRDDFEQGHHGYHRLSDLFAAYAEHLTDDEAARRRIRRGEVRISHLRYDWSLNDKRS